MPDTNACSAGDKSSDEPSHFMGTPMPTLSRILSSAVEKLMFHPVTITGVEAVGESFRLLSMQGVGFQGVKWIPGVAWHLNRGFRVYIFQHFSTI